VPIGPVPIDRDGGSAAGLRYSRRVISWPHLSIGVTLAASSLLGAGVRSGRLELGGRGWPHHVLYAATLVSSVSAATVDAARGRPTWPVAAGTLGLLAFLPATGGGSDAHLMVAGAASVAYLAGTIVVTRRSPVRS